MRILTQNSNSSVSIFAAVWFSICGVQGAFGKEAKRLGSAPEILIEFQIIRMPQDLATDLMPELLDPTKIETAYAKIGKLLTEHKARIIAWPTIVTKSGERAVYECIEEIRYASEYRPPQVAAQKIDPKTIGSDKPAIKLEPKIDMSAFEAVPSNFETRNSGVTLEIEPLSSMDGQVIDISLVPQNVELLGSNKITIENASSGSKIIVEQPEFHTEKTTTTFTLRSGQRTIVGFYPHPKSEGEGDLFLLKASTLPGPKVKPHEFDRSRPKVLDQVPR